MDIGGDDRGALALGRYVPDLRAENDFDFLAVVNASRPLTQTVADTVEVLREIEAACSLRFTGVVNNTNLGPDTTAEKVIGSAAYADGVAAALGTEVKFTCAPLALADELAGRVPNLLPLRIQRLYYHLDA